MHTYRSLPSIRILFCVYLLATLLRSRNSINHLIPDPGLGFQLAARSDGVLETFESFYGYPQVAPRILSELLNLVPLAQLTYWSTALNAVIVALCALIIAKSLSKALGPWIASAIGLVTTAIFPAYEGLIGNVWAVRWILLPTTCIIVASEFAKIYWRTSLFVFATTGISHAWVVIPAVIFVAQAVINRDRSYKTVLLGSGLVGTALFQCVAFLNGTRSGRLYGDETVYWPWSGSGIYWLAVFSVPLVFAFLAVVLSLPKFLKLHKTLPTEIVLTLQAALLACISYLQLGIKSSPAVATVVVSYTALIAVSVETAKNKRLMTLRGLVPIAATVALLVLSARYFFASPYLTNGPNWSTVVRQSQLECSTLLTETTELIYYSSNDVVNSETLSCDVFRDWTRWFFLR